MKLVFGGSGRREKFLNSPPKSEKNSGSSVAVMSSGAFVIFGFNTDVKCANTVYHVQSEARQHELLLQTQVFVKGRCIGKHATSYAEQTKDPGFSEEHMHEMLKDQHKHFVTAVREGRIEAELTAHGHEQDDHEDDELKAAAAAFAEPTVSVAAAAPVVAVEVAASAPPVIPAPSLPVSPAAVAPPPTVLERAVAPLDIEIASAPLDDLAAQFAAAVAEKPVDPGLTLTALGGVIGKGLSVDCLPPTPTPGGSSVTICVQIADENGPAGGVQVSCRISSGQGPATYVYATSSPGGVADIAVSLNGLDLTRTALLIQASHRGKSASRRFSLRKS